MGLHKIHLVTIDPQQDFCHPDGALFVPGAPDDIRRLAAMIQRIGDRIDEIHVTLDSHHDVHIAHPIWWVNGRGEHPDPFTIISAKDVENGVWSAKRPSLHKRSLAYVRTLEANGRYPLCIWPPHCLIGSRGHAVVPELFDVLQEWERRKFFPVHYLTKGSNLYSEHYGALQADVPDPSDPSTQLDTAFIRTLEEADIILLAGEAGSHCLANTVIDLADNFGDEATIRKLHLLTDATSPVAGFEPTQRDFIQRMTQRGMQLTTTTDFLASKSLATVR